MVLWNFTIDDTSPYLSYSPYADGSGLGNGWQTWYTLSHYNTILDEASQGDSYHITSKTNASITLQFYGTGVSLFGSTNTSFDVIIDNDTRTSINASTTPLLYSNYDLKNDIHSITISVQPSNSSQTLAFDSAVASTPLDNNENPPSPLFYDSSDTASLRYSGAWATGTAKGVPNSTVSSPFRVTTEYGASVSLTFTGGSAVALKGLVDSSGGIYSVSIDGSTRTFNGTSQWIIPDALLYFRAGLDPTTPHQVNVTHLSNGTKLCLNSITVFKHEPKIPATLNPSSKAVMAPHPPSRLGIVLGSVLGCIFLIFVGAFLLYRRQRYLVVYSILFGRPAGLKPSIRTPKTTGTPILPTLSHLNPESSDTDSRVNLLSPQGLGQRSPTIIVNPRVKDTSPLTDRERPDGSSMTNTSLSSSPYDNHSWPGLEADIRSQRPSSPPQTQFQVPPSHTRSASSDNSSSYHNSSHHPIFPAPRYTLSLPRKPLPVIPVPSYDAALQTPELTSAEAKGMASLGGSYSGLDTPYTAPPRYER